MTQVTRLNRKDAAEYLATNHGIRRSPRTLAKLACVGGGPRFRKAGPSVVYETSALDDWADTLLSPEVGSTSELAGA